MHTGLLVHVNTCTLLIHSTTKSKCGAGKQMKAQLLKMRQQLDAERVQVEDHKEEENGERQRGKRRERPRW